MFAFYLRTICLIKPFFFILGRVLKIWIFLFFQDPLFLEKFVIKDLPVGGGEENEDGALEFQVYSSHHVSRRHLVGVASIRLIDVDKLTSGQVELLVTPQTVYRVSKSMLWQLTSVYTWPLSTSDPCLQLTSVYICYLLVYIWPLCQHLTFSTVSTPDLCD